MQPIVRVCWLALLLLVSGSATASTGKITAVFEKYFSAQAGHAPADLVTRTDFDQVVGLLANYEIDTERFAPLRERIPSDDSYLQRLAKSSHGKSFLRKVATPDGYRAIDQLASTRGGEQALGQIVDAKGGEEMVRYMATTKGGKNLLNMAPGGKSSKKRQSEPIYTAAQLLQAMLSLATPGGGQTP